MSIRSTRYYPAVGYTHSIFLGSGSVFNRLNTAGQQTDIYPQEVIGAEINIFDKNGNIILTLTDSFDWQSRTCTVAADVLATLPMTDSSNALWWELTIRNETTVSTPQGGRLFVYENVSVDNVGTPTGKNELEAIRNVTEADSVALYAYGIRDLRTFATTDPRILADVMQRGRVSIKTIEDVTDARSIAGLPWAHPWRRNPPTNADSPDYPNQFWELDDFEIDGTVHRTAIWWHSTEDNRWIRVMPDEAA